MFNIGSSTAVGGNVLTKQEDDDDFDDSDDDETIEIYNKKGRLSTMDFVDEMPKINHPYDD